MWGQVLIYLNNPLHTGIIPTRVGTSLLVTGKGCKQRDHPHACGDKKEKSSALNEMKGSSPRVWGQDDLSLGEKYCGGIIPTRVGTSKAFYNFCIQEEDHPHACGDKEMLRL